LYEDSKMYAENSVFLALLSDEINVDPRAGAKRKTELKYSWTFARFSTMAAPPCSAGGC